VVEIGVTAEVGLQRVATVRSIQGGVEAARTSRTGGEAASARMWRYARAITARRDPDDSQDVVVGVKKR